MVWRKREGGNTSKILYLHQLRRQRITQCDTVLRRKVQNHPSPRWCIDSTIISAIQVLIGRVPTGTDWGAILLRILAANHSDSCKAVHGPPMAAPSVTNLKHVAQLINCTVPGLSKRPLFLSPSELKGLQTTLRYVLRGSGIACIPFP